MPLMPPYNRRHCSYTNTMTNFQRNQKLKILYIVTVCWLLFIWTHSMIPAEISSEESQFVGGLIRPFLELFIGSGAVTDFIVRKLAHFTEYAILGMLLSSIALVRFERPDFYHLSYCLLIVLAAAVIDESIQLITPGRSSQVTDVLIDTSGGLTGIILLRTAAFVRKHIRQSARK